MILDYEINLTSQALNALLSSAFPSDLVEACLYLQSLLAADCSAADDLVRLERV